ncbi:Mitochondrial import receptor subunit TOM70 [Sarcoptes scabiei]|uniref:Mitochondrial import receptor subunit TOM70 n=1 Tax=Sarcoptes scabiei TaxID=52283 RepID=A0A834R304_SARSC|nr:Mitochondrial import receptor subunit TOM70 [Sarcoptes scabiei]
MTTMTILPQLSNYRTILLATPIIVGAGVYVYRCYFANKHPKFSPADPIQLKSKAISLKDKGNDLFRQKKFLEAIKLYSEAIEICPQKQTMEIAKFYQNRAACYEQLKDFDMVIKDAGKAIELNPKYTRAFVRRARAFESSNRLEEAIYDYYTASSINEFKDSDMMNLFSDCLDKYSHNESMKIIKKRRKITFQKYMFKRLLDQFNRDPLRQRKKEILNDYENSIDKLLNDDDEEKLSQDDLMIKALIEMIIGKQNEGVLKLNKIIESSEDIEYKVYALVKLAESAVENNKLEDSNNFLDEAEKLDPKNPNIFMIRSQVLLLSRKYDESLKELSKTIELDPDYLSPIAQQLFIRYQQSLILNNSEEKSKVLKEFDEYAEKYSDNNEILLLYFQVLINENDMEKSEKIIIKAIENNSEDPNLYAYRATIYIGSDRFEYAKELLDKALKTDSRCSLAYEILSDFYSRFGNFDLSLDYLDKAINNSTTFNDIKNFIIKKMSIVIQLKSLSV